MYSIYCIKKGRYVMSEKKDAVLIVKMSKELADTFTTKCKENSINRSQLIRNFVKAYIESNSNK